MSQKDDEVRIAVLETKFDTLIKVVKEMQAMIVKFSDSVVKDHREEMTSIRKELADLKVENAVIHKTTQENSRRIGRMSGVIWSFLSIVGVSVLAAIVNSVLK